jgi:hypothetical protein
MLLFSMKAMEVIPRMLNRAGTNRSESDEHRALVRPGASNRGHLVGNQPAHLSAVQSFTVQNRRYLVSTVLGEQPALLQHSHRQSPPDIAGTLISRTMSKDTTNTPVDCISPKRQLIEK